MPSVPRHPCRQPSTIRVGKVAALPSPSTAGPWHFYFALLPSAFFKSSIYPLLRIDTRTYKHTYTRTIKPNHSRDSSNTPEKTYTQQHSSTNPTSTIEYDVPTCQTSPVAFLSYTGRYSTSSLGLQPFDIRFLSVTSRVKSQASSKPQQCSLARISPGAAVAVATKLAASAQNAEYAHGLSTYSNIQC